MLRLTITNTFKSALHVGDPKVLSCVVPAGETQSIKATEAQIRQILPGLKKLHTAKCLNYTVDAWVAPPQVEATETEVAPVKPTFFSKKNRNR